MYITETTALLPNQGTNETLGRGIGSYQKVENNELQFIQQINVRCGRNSLG